MRIGQGGNVVNIWKIRTMYPDADKPLKTYLEQNPQMRAEWEVTQKLNNDPRVTQIGRILRKFSLDEFPQLINVLKGEMRLAGPGLTCQIRSACIKNVSPFTSMSYRA